MNTDQQIMIVVDNQDNLIGYEKRKKCHTGQGVHHRAFVVLLENLKGEVLLQKRKHKLWDNYWDTTAISHPLHLTNHDETYDDAAKRALKNEMGITDVKLENIGGFNYFAKYKESCENEYCAILTGFYNGKVSINKDLVYDYKWVKKSSFIQDSLNQKETFTPWAIHTGIFIHRKETHTPQHIALIMDGNRRWAKSKGLPIPFGHRKGYQKIEEIVQYARKKGITHITFWAFSTENWNREEKEVKDLMNIFRRVLKKSSFKRILKENAKLVIFGDLSEFPKDIQENVKEVLKDSKNNTGITVNIALNYGGRIEIIRAVNNLLKTGVKVADEKLFNDNLYSQGQPDPDLIIRTGGEKRLSGYLPWQSVYSELYFTDVLWPDFDVKQLDIALDDYATRQRRFGI